MKPPNIEINTEEHETFTKNRPAGFSILNINEATNDGKIFLTLKKPIWYFSDGTPEAIPNTTEHHHTSMVNVPTNQDITS